MPGRSSAHVNAGCTKSAPTYTDDPFLVCVGAPRLARAVTLWTRLLQAIGIAVAIPAKRQFGASLRWLGLDFFLSLGVFSRARE